MVEEGKARGLTARFQSIQWAAIYGASLLAGIGGGYLSAHVSYNRTFLLVALFPALSFAASAWAVREPRTRFDRATVRETVAALRRGVRSGPLWRAAAFIFLWNFSPSFGVPLEYHMVDVLGITKIQLGVLTSLGSGAAMLGALVFGRYATRLAPRPLLNLAIAIGVAGTLAYYGLVGWWSAVALTVAVSFVTAIALLATLDLAARAVPSHAEGTFFAALMSVSNLGTTGGAVARAGSSTTWSGSPGSSPSARPRRRRAGSSCPGSGSRVPGPPLTPRRRPASRGAARRRLRGSASAGSRRSRRPSPEEVEAEHRHRDGRARAARRSRGRSACTGARRSA